MTKHQRYIKLLERYLDTLRQKLIYEHMVKFGKTEEKAKAELPSKEDFGKDIRKLWTGQTKTGQKRRGV